MHLQKDKVSQDVLLVLFFGQNLYRRLRMHRVL